MKRPTLILLFVAVSAISHGATPDFVPNYDESKAGRYTLPDPLICVDGTPVRDAATWRSKRRRELLELFAREVYGRTPSGRPPGMHWVVTSVDRGALGGKAVRKEITVRFTENKNGPQMRLLVYLPPTDQARKGPWPVFLGLNYFGNQCVDRDPGITISQAWIRSRPDFKVVDNRATEGTRGVHGSRWNIEKVLARGYATATVYYGDLCEDRPEGLTSDVGALFRTSSMNDRSPDAWGAIGIWAWGLSRAVDYLITDREIDGRGIAVHGHSRLGKAALWAGAQDERFALVISNDSGCGGAALSKRIFGETVGRINDAFPFWFARNFRTYNEREHALPIDQHELVALIAPRAVHVASAEDDRWADPQGEFLSLKGAERVFALHGKKGLGITDMPAVNRPVLGDAMAYHVRTGEHDITAFDWAQYLDFADRVFTR